MELQVTCPHCNGLTVDDGTLSGRVVDCSHCGQRFAMPVRAIETTPNGSDNLFGIVTKPTSIPQKRRSGRHDRKVAKTDDSLKVTFGVIGAAGLFLGLFVPIIKVSIFGGLSYLDMLQLEFKSDESELTEIGVMGILIMIAAVASFILVLRRSFPALWLTGVGALCAVGFTFARFQMRLNELQSETSDNPLGQIVAQSIGLDWGFGVIIIGAVLLITSAAVSGKPR